MFAGIFRRREIDATTTLSPLETQRNIQVENLKALFPQIIEIQRNTEYRIPVADPVNRLDINIHLPVLFPQEKPIISVSPSVKHLWVNEQQQVVGCSELLKFSMHSDLGKIVQEIIQEFQNNPPMSCNSTRSTPFSPYYTSPDSKLPEPSSAPYSAITFQGSSKSSFRIPLPQESHHNYEMPPFPTTFPGLTDLSAAELTDLFEDDEKQSSFLLKLPELQRVVHDRDQLSDVNEKLAKGNLDMQPVLEERKKVVMEMIDSINSLRETFDDYSHQHLVLAEQFAPSTIEESLRIAALEAEECSEKISKDFLEGKLDIETFLSKFVDKKMLGNCRRSKEERLHHQLAELKKSGF